MRKLFASAMTAGLLTALLGAAGSPVFAKSSDRNQDMLIGADSTDYATDGSRPSILSGNVSIVQGTLDIRSGRAEVTQRGGEPVRVLLTGGVVHIKQQLDNGGWMTATANKVDYDLKAETATLTGNVKIEESGAANKTVSGERFVYNMKTNVVNGGEPGKSRINIRIPPKTTTTKPQGGT